MGQYYEPHIPPFFLWYESKDNSIQRNQMAFDRPDDAIVDDLERSFAMLHHIDASHVQIDCEKDIVTLSGSCENRLVKNYLGALADNTLGVRSVRNQVVEWEGPKYPAIPPETKF